MNTNRGKKRSREEMGRTTFVEDISTDDSIWDEMTTPPPSPVKFSPEQSAALEEEAATILNLLRLEFEY